MAFLHGVLKDVYEKQPYKVGKESHLKSVVDALHSKLCSGHEGFKRVIGHVADGVGRYNREVEGSNNHVKSKIEGFDREMKKLKTTVSKILETHSVAGTDDPLKIEQAEELINKRLDDYLSKATTFNHTLDMHNNQMETRNAISNLSDKLRGMLDNVHRTMVYEKTRLTDLSDKEKDELRETKEKIKTTLQSAGSCVNTQISERVTAFATELRKRVQTIFEKLEIVNRDLPTYVDSLQVWINDTDKDIESAQRHVKAITEQAEGGITSNKNPIEDAVKELEKTRSALDTYISGERSGLTELVNKVNAAITALGEQFPALKSRTLPTSIDGIFDNIRTTVAQINGKSGDAFSMGFEGIKDAFKKYAEGFTQGKFEDIVKSWSNEIVDKVGGASGLRGYLVSHRKLGHGNGGNLNKLLLAIKREIPSQLKSEVIEVAAQTFSSTPGENIDTDLKGVQAVCKGFADSLYPQISKKAGEIIGAIKSDLTSLGITKTGDNYEKDLISAVQLILHHLVGAARGAAMELHSLVNEQKQIGGEQTTMSKVIEEAHTKAKSLHSQLQQATGKIGGRTSGTNHAQAVDTAIKAVKSRAEDITIEITTEALQRLSNEINANLRKLTSTISDSAYAVGLTLENLRTKKIGKSPNKGELQKLQQQLHDLKAPVSVAHDTAKRFLAGVDNLVKVTIQDLKSDVDGQIDTATKQLTTHAQKQYVLSVSSLLVSFSTKVETELQPLPNLITKDLDLGVKGFMKTFEKHFMTSQKSIKGISDIKNTFSPPEKSPLSQASVKLHGSIKRLFQHLQKQEDFKAFFPKTQPSHDAARRLLDGLETSQHFDPAFVDNLNRLRKSLTTLTAEKSCEPSAHILDALREGYSAMIAELDKVYMNVYAGAKPIDKWSEPLPADQPSKPTGATPETKLTPNGRRGAKVCLTIVPIVYTALKHLKNGLEEGDWKGHKIYNPADRKSSLHELFFADNGYDVGSPSTISCGELNHRHDFNGSNILNNLNGDADALFTSSPTPLASPLRSGDQDIPVEYNEEDGVVPKLHSYLKPYAQVGHLATFAATRTPCSVYEQLIWLTGLQFNGVYDKLHEHCDSLFEKKPDAHNTELNIPVPIPAYPNPISNDRIDSTIEHLTSRAYYLLTGIVGHGDAECRYACDYSTNFLKLKYPTNGQDCLHTLLDILRKITPALNFMCKQCSSPAADFGWRDCLYGKGIRSTKWPCNEHVTDQRRCQANDQSTDKAIGQPKCESNCQPTSPLMSYLNDCLPGHLPHQLQSVGCKSICATCPKSTPGMPCITPLEFRAFSGSTKTGRDMCDIIRAFLDFDGISCIFSLAPKPPSTLPEHFGFALSLANGLSGRKPKNVDGVKSFSEAFETSLSNRSIKIYDVVDDFIMPLCNAYGDGRCGELGCDNSHLVSLTSAATCSSNNRHCAPYFQTSCSEVYKYMSNKSADTCLSWSVYLAWKFHECLESLLKSLKDILCEDWGCRKCIESDTCKRGEHGVLQDSCKCFSVVSCRGISPTLYKYGLLFGDSFTLNQGIYRKKCSDLITQLRKVLNSKYFQDLFTECDNFLKEIRWPFMLTLLALWSLSLLYLLHITVVRLDVLRIRSHLRSPASHRIAAQSLLAAARVKALANVKYFSP
ncbi:hypothetical protein, conserved [Babesia ovata]|uniref:C3H1-type domain-containing protein n=1 Tax=Babesia ovata TaxID=189622 RepID=A0A2H6KKF3_9APIC|nr:uncharacterized protein BOVATA_049550 [Babesia ovata]GBE63462.1 hypothetical protein, conserved [Babesia ovata]